ncbi:metallophosphoesterase [Actinoplanes ianthinogenes]|uniref:Metallophosphoesterase n=1 Tax=Actinoplanes ianthinogenes TaxID=122358 RepID=A0ABM7M2I0_9ACTN|nr:metallophosphoesterase [Actinoplanes ianthinogenes]BCJ45768.1 metallophosphoesterase [Actinoplanes ianthinogenes]GGR32091.1 metallophosphoesterase [Actinoplanes ianthinogenes]
MLTVAHLSDLHLGAHEPDAVPSLIADVAAAAPDLTVVTGDWTMRARPREFTLARAVLEELPRPLLAVTGNHDLPLISPLRLAEPYERYRAWIDDDLDPVAGLPGLTALGLQSMPRWRWKDGLITGRQAELITSVFGAAPEDDVKVIALHHPPVGTALAGRRRFLRAARTAGVDLILAGHTHIPDVRRIEGVAVVVAGTATSHRTRGVPRSWSLIRVDTEAITVTERYDADRGWETGRIMTLLRSLRIG